MLVTAALLVAAFAMEACSPAPSASPPGAAAFGLEGTRWVAVAINDMHTVADSPPMLSFGDGVVSGTTGCNAFGATVVAGPDGSVRFSDLAVTKVACAGRLGQQEQAFLAIIGAVTAIALDEGMLFVSGGAGRTVFEQQPAGSGDAAG